MYPFDYLAWSNNQKHSELLRHANEYRLVDEALRTKTPNTTKLSKLLALVGKELSSVGYSLEVRYDSRPDTHPALNQQSNLGGCP